MRKPLLVKKSTKGRRSAGPKGIAVPDDACPSCGTMMLEARGRLLFSVNGERITVPDVSHLRCQSCPEKLLRLDEARQLREGAFEIYRQRYGLLSGDEIRAIRERHRMTQSHFATLLRLGGNTISRWEAGRNVQSSAMDILLRLIRDVPESLCYLRKHAA